MIVVSDTTAITSLLGINRVDLLSELFEDVRIPVAVRDELLCFHDSVPTFLKVHEITRSIPVKSPLGSLDQGEIEAILLAEELEANLLLIDEKKAVPSPKAEDWNASGLPALYCWRSNEGSSKTSWKFWTNSGLKQISF